MFDLKSPSLSFLFLSLKFFILFLVVEQLIFDIFWVFIRLVLGECEVVQKIIGVVGVVGDLVLELVVLVFSNLLLAV